MTQGEKYLLLKDLCMRLPYGVKIQYDIYCIQDLTIDKLNAYIKGIKNIKPYLRPMESMTQEDELELIDKGFGYYVNGHEFCFVKKPELIDWFNEKMFDWRGLIPKDLALSTEKYNPYVEN